MNESGLTTEPTAPALPVAPVPSPPQVWYTLHAATVARFVEDALRDEAWWTAARSGKYAQCTVVWADGP